MSPRTDRWVERGLLSPACGPRQGQSLSGVCVYVTSVPARPCVYVCVKKIQECVRIHCVWVAQGQWCPAAPSPTRGSLRRPARSAAVVEGPALQESVNTGCGHYPIPSHPIPPDDYHLAVHSPVLQSKGIPEHPSSGRRTTLPPAETAAAPDPGQCLGHTHCESARGAQTALGCAALRSAAAFASVCSLALLDRRTPPVLPLQRQNQLERRKAAYWGPRTEDTTRTSPSMFHRVRPHIGCIQCTSLFQVGGHILCQYCHQKL